MIAEEIDQALREPLTRQVSSSSQAQETPTTPPLLEIERINLFFIRASILSILTWVLMIAAVYLSTPREEWVYLSSSEREAASLAFFVLLTASVLVLSPFVVQRKVRSMTPVVHAAIVTQVISMLTNGMLAFLPTVVMVDPVTHARVFLIRWCEWVPLAGLMTFFSEAVEITKTKNGTKVAVVASVCQSLSCLCGMLLPFCGGLVSWNIVMFFSFITYFAIFPRVVSKRRLLLNTKKGRSFIEHERYDRVRFSYELMFICMIVWTLLVVLYFINMAIHRLCPVGHILRHEALAMAMDTLFDVTAKALYMKVIIDVHFAVFDAEGRAQRQLGELRNLMNVLWDNSADLIIISVRHSGKVTSLLSPSFSKLVDCELPREVRDRKGVALMIEADQGESDESMGSITQAHYIDSSNIPYGGLVQQALLAPLEPESPEATKAVGVVVAAWTRSCMSNDDDKSSSLVVYPMKTLKNEECNCEVKVSSHAENALVAIVRDVTERYKRFEAERRAHSETLARQKDAQSQTRFVRHEVKNGLLAGVELCDSLRNAIDDTQKEMARMRKLLTEAQKDQSDTSDKHSELARRLTEELDVTLHEVLDTVLAEAMARDVVHEIYKPRLERLDVVSLLVNCSGSKVGKSERFPIKSMQTDLPFLQLDPQLLRYIHRNAVSNACKYGKLGGTVTTEVGFEPETKTFVMNVVNEPGAGHETLVGMNSETANGTVFAQGATLHSDVLSRDRFISSGDGAWIMQKCARTMDGFCRIKFEESRTVFTFSCPAEPLTVVEWPETKDFEVPEDTWGIAIDDSKIQRKLMGRILAHAGVQENRRIVIGQSPTEVSSVEPTIVDLLKNHRKAKILVLIDENLDFGVNESEHVIISGSLVMKSILERLTPNQERRVFALVRSANDSAEDVALYLSRTHGFFPKAPMQRERVREILAPLWAERFLANLSSASTKSVRSLDDIGLEDAVSREDLLFSLGAVDRLVHENEMDEKEWSHIWGSLHALKGDLMVIEESPLVDEALALIGTMKGDSMPEDFASQWTKVREVVLKAVSRSSTSSIDS